MAEPSAVNSGRVCVVEIPLDEEERAGLRASAELLRRTMDSARAVQS